MVEIGPIAATGQKPCVLNQNERENRVSNLPPGKKPKLIFFLCCIFLIGSNYASADGLAALPENVKAIYLPSHCFTERKISEFTHYARLAGLNAVVLHVKDSNGLIYWRTRNQTAIKNEAVAANGLLEQALKTLKSRGFWCIAKLDVFVDHRLVRNNPNLGILDMRTGGPWSDKKGLYWANPFNRQVWEYNLALCRELVELGFNEIQFDYIRFPSDGDLAVVNYPGKPENLDRTECIGKFLETAYAGLKPTGIMISVDLFGLVAWKTEDFGVGQQIEAIAPHVDVICPMLYPSHFPRGFLGKPNPGDFPFDIMALSMQRIKSRTNKRIRPWIQSFWYTADDINAQIDGLSEAQTSSWAAWNPSGNYTTTYRAFAKRLDQAFPEPQFYPSVAEIGNQAERIVGGNFRIVNLTNYIQGYSIISLEEARRDRPSSYSTLIQVLGTLDEGIMDRILKVRLVPFSRLTGSYFKKLRLAELFCQDLQIDPRVLRPKPVYIDWQNDCRFTRTIPEDRLSSYRSAGETAFAKDRNVYANFPNPKTR
jgi:hypothetical protein